MNNKYTIRISHTLIRPGLSIETESSEKYLTAVVKTLMEAFGVFNKKNPESFPSVLSAGKDADSPLCIWPYWQVANQIIKSDETFISHDNADLVLEQFGLVWGVTIGSADMKTIRWYWTIYTTNYDDDIVDYGWSSTKKNCATAVVIAVAKLIKEGELK